MKSPIAWLETLRERGLFAGLGYNATVTLALMTSWDVETFVGDVTEIGLLPALKNAATFWFFMCAHQLPTLPLLTVGVNLAPAAGIRRYLWLGAVGALVWGFCTFFFWYENVLDSWNEQYAVMVTLIIAACAYRSAGRTASSRLLERETESAALDAEVKRARLSLLRAQIEPHFLFNTLATVRTLARVEPAAAVDMLDNLMRYLTEALPKLRQDESSLADEVQLIEAYLRIHQIRMGRRLSYQLQVPAQLAGERIPTMILLTLVENAVKHGINPAVEGGTIRVSASRGPSALVLQVADSGRGLTATDGHGTGLANIRSRLTALYGDQAELTLARAPTRGVVATVSIPLAAA